MSRTVEAWVDLSPGGVFTRHAEVKITEYVTRTYGDLTCKCGNEPSGTGFWTCLEDGTVVSPDNRGGWGGVLLVCGDCGRVINQDTGEVVDRRDPTEVMNEAADVYGWDD